MNSNAVPMEAESTAFQAMFKQAPDDRPARKASRARRADSRANGKKSRRNAARQQRAEQEFQQNLLGMARVYLEGAGSDAMRHNVTVHVHTIAEERSKQVGQPFTTALKEVEGKLLSALVAARG